MNGRQSVRTRLPVAKKAKKAEIEFNEANWRIKMELLFVDKVQRSFYKELGDFFKSDEISTS